MKYQQIALTRLSEAGRKFQKDGQWHPFGDAADSYYRITSRIVQRVRIEEDEDHSLLLLFNDLPPFPSKIFREGFREELRFRVEDDRYILGDMYIRFYIGWDLLARAGLNYDIRIKYQGGNSLQYFIILHEWSQDSILKAIILSKAFSTVAAHLYEDAKEGIPHIESEINGLIKTAYNVMLEDSYEPLTNRKRKPPDQIQTSLFSEW